VVAICGCWFEEDCWWLCFWGQVGCDSMTSMCCIALICITCHMKRILRTELVLWISAPDMLQQHCLPYEENLKSRASFVDLCTWHVAALPATWRELKKQSFFCGSLCLTCCSIVIEKLKLLPCCCPLVGACLQRIVDGFTFKIKSRMQFHDSVHCLPHEENSKSSLCGFMTCPSIAREKLLPCCCHLLGAYSLKKKKIVDGCTLKTRLDAILWVYAMAREKLFPSCCCHLWVAATWRRLWMFVLSRLGWMQVCKFAALPHEEN
jgi:hypothetical protein